MRQKVGEYTKDIRYKRSARMQKVTMKYERVASNFQVQRLKMKTR